ncbi:translation elongation factor EF-1alpha (GTPase) HBS1 isoform X2 [Brevipalpus obovatus]
MSQLFMDAPNGSSDTFVNTEDQASNTLKSSLEMSHHIRLTLQSSNDVHSNSIDDDNFESLFLNNEPSNFPIDTPNAQSQDRKPESCLSQLQGCFNAEYEPRVFSPSYQPYPFAAKRHDSMSFDHQISGILSNLRVQPQSDHQEIRREKPSNLLLVLTAKYRKDEKYPDFAKSCIRKRLTEYRADPVLKSFDFSIPLAVEDSFKLQRVTPVISKETPKSSSQNEPVQININSSFSQRLDNKSTLSPLRDKRDSSVDKRPRKKSPAPPDRNAGPQVIGITKQVKTVSRDAMLEEFKKIRSQTKPLINLVVIGHVDAGKSTLMGRLLYDLGCVTKKSMHRYETDSKKIGKESFLYAWILDETDEERTRGITMDIGLFRFETPSKSVNILDAPGHRDFIPNMITGASHADVAILIVDATRGEFEAGFDSGGQTREHALLVRSLGVTQLIVVINKLDNVKWSQERYNEVKNKLAPFLAKQCGFKEQDITYVPCSGFHGQNVASRSAIPELTSWYQGPCLLEVIDSLSEPERAVAKSFRLNISDVFKGPVSGVCVSGQIDSGTVQIGQRLIVMPNSEQAVVKAISLDEANVQQAFAGDQVALTLSGCDAANIAIGNIVCDLNDPSPVSTRFESRILLFNLPVPLTKGFPLVLHCKNLQEQVVIKTILAQLNKSTGKVVKNKPRCLTSNTSALVELEASRPISLELYQDYKDLGRITLRSNGVTVAAGLVTKVF